MKVTNSYIGWVFFEEKLMKKLEAYKTEYFK